MAVESQVPDLPVIDVHVPLFIKYQLELKHMVMEG